MRERTSSLPPPAGRVIIYELFVRLFGNGNTTNSVDGDRAANGSGTFGAIGDAAIEHIRTLGVTHVWLMGVVRHASLASYPSLGPGFEGDAPDVVKGRAGSPYAIRDYYDVDPDLADDPAHRMREFRALVARLHAAGLRVLIDLVPNHVSRAYASTQRPAADFGQGDDKTVFFSPENDFFYLVEPPGQRLVLPTPDHWRPSGVHFAGSFEPEDGSPGRPPRATGNNVTLASPGHNDWYETVKLNYGFNFAEPRAEHATAYSPTPPVWRKVDDILAYWQGLGVDGFRCDFAHFAPVEFWHWAIARARARAPHAYFVAEAYGNDDGSPQAGSPPRTSPHSLVAEGGFDAVYDGASFRVSRLLAAGTRWANDFDDVRAHDWAIDAFVRYAENHDERRGASPVLAGAHDAGETGYGSPEACFAATAALALSTGAPVLLYAGQEVGERGDGTEGYGGNDGRSSIFDYWSPPALAALHRAAYDDARLAAHEARLIARYRVLLRLADEPAMRAGGAYAALNPANRDASDFGQHGRFVYAFLRYIPGGQALLVVINLDPRTSYAPRVRIPEATLAKVAPGGASSLVALPVVAGPYLAPQHVSAAQLRDRGLLVALAPNDVAVWALEVTAI